MPIEELPHIVESAAEFPFPGWNEGFTTSAPLAFARNVMRLPASTVEGVASIVQVTDGHGGSVTSKLTVQVVWPVVTHSLGQSTAGTVAVTVVVTE